MQIDVQIFELGGKTKQEVLREVAKLLSDHEVERFTLILKRKPLPPDSPSLNRTPQIDVLLQKLGTRPKSSTFDRLCQSGYFVNHKTLSSYHRDSEEAELEDLFPATPKELAFRLYRKGQWAEALLLLEKAKETFQAGQLRQVETMIGNSLFQLKRVQQATDIYKNLLEGAGQKQKGQLFNSLGCCYGILGQQKLSMSSYSKALEIYGAFPEIDCASLLTNIANMYFGCKMYQVAEKYYHLAIQQRRTKRPQLRALLYHGYYKLSLAQVEQKKFKGAEESLERALELAEQGLGDRDEVLKQSALVKQLQGKWAQALPFYQLMHSNCVEQKKGKGFIYEKVGRIYQNLGKAAEHLKYIRLAQQEYNVEGNFRKLSQLSKGLPFVG